MAEPSPSDAAAGTSSADLKSTDAATESTARPVESVPANNPDRTGEATVEGVEADPDILEVDDSDSALGSVVSSRSQSITSSITGYKYENGRRCTLI